MDPIGAGERSPDLPPGLSGGRPASDERRHPDATVEAWWWWGSSTDHVTGALIGVFVGFELRGRRFDYWAGLVREGEPYLLIEELDGTGLRQGLEIKPPEMWAGHECDAPFRQWSLGNEAHGVLLDDPLEAWQRAHGTPVPVTFDVEWYAMSTATTLDDLVPGADGYRQEGEVDVRIELTEGIVSFTGPGERVHVWGAPYLPTSFAMPNDTRGVRAPYRRHDGRRIDQVLATSPSRGSRWWVNR
ncbi:MAG: hypothetical protein KDB40_15900 [Acidimicrobiales bacterium]|nr:hypothetical protein [Acidimicrobiales bacterium]MCB9393529.1 hypothetical protein [Acidimicrobiaceae bacterium]